MSGTYYVSSVDYNIALLTIDALRAAYDSLIGRCVSYYDLGIDINQDDLGGSPIVSHEHVLQALSEYMTARVNGSSVYDVHTSSPVYSVSNWWDIVADLNCSVEIASSLNMCNACSEIKMLNSAGVIAIIV